MLKGHKYNQPYKKHRPKSVYEQEYSLLHEFHGSDHKNLQLEYGSNKEAHNAQIALCKYIKKAHQPLKCSVRGNFVFVFRKGEE